MRLLVVCGSEPNNSRFLSPHRRMHAQPPGPGLPRQAPSVMSWTFFIAFGAARSGVRQFELTREECIHQMKDPRSLRSVVDFGAQLRAVANPVREVSCELLHLADGIRLVALPQHGVIRPQDLVPAALGRM